MRNKEIDQVAVPKERFLEVAEVVKKMEDGVQIPLTFTLSALYPTVWDNIQSALKEAYTNGFLQGQKEKI